MTTMVAVSLRALSLGTITAVAGLFDLKFHRIPDVAIGCGLVVEVALAASLLHSVCGGLLGYTVFWVVRRLSGDRLGQGDLKYSLYLGAALGAHGWWCATLFASCAALMVALVPRSRNVRTVGPIPFAPFLSVGALVTRAADVAFANWGGSPAP